MKRKKCISGWIGLRSELSRQALQDVGTKASNAAPIVLGVMGPLLLGLLAMLAAPLLYAVTLPLPEGLALFAAHTLVAAIPIFMLRQRVLPDSLLAWEAGLPIPPHHRIVGDALATTILVAPLFVAYLVSSLVWFWQWPPWLRPVWAAGSAAILASTLGTWLIGMLLLSLRSRSLRASRRGSGAAAIHRHDLEAARIPLVAQPGRGACSVAEAAVAAQCPAMACRSSSADRARRCVPVGDALAPARNLYLAACLGNAVGPVVRCRGSMARRPDAVESHSPGEGNCRLARLVRAPECGLKNMGPAADDLASAPPPGGDFIGCTIP